MAIRRCKECKRSVSKGHRPGCGNNGRSVNSGRSVSGRKKRDLTFDPRSAEQPDPPSREAQIWRDAPPSTPFHWAKMPIREAP